MCSDSLSEKQLDLKPKIFCGGLTVNNNLLPLTPTSDNPPDCLTPTLEDRALSEMLVKVADKDKYYIGGEMLRQVLNVGKQTPEGVKLVGQT